MSGSPSVAIDMATLEKLLAEYEATVVETDIIDINELHPIQQGLFGEVGGIMATAKKLVREKNAYPGYRKAAEEEFGDTLWYLTAICRRRKLSLVDVFNYAEAAAAPIPLTTDPYAKCNLESIPQGPKAKADMDVALMRLGQSTAKILNDVPNLEQIQTFASSYLEALSATSLQFTDVVRSNMRKVCGAFLEPQPADLTDFDKEFDPDEQLPREFRIVIKQRSTGKSYLQWKGVFIGDPLTDNIGEQDGYRFHDVFHFANAAILHWSPVVRSLIKQKRKSKGNFDEEQDSGRAIVVEEGLTAWIFSKAKELNYFESQTRVSLDILKTIQEFVAGYEVERCPLKLWERSILQGYDVFRKMKAARGGAIVGDREARAVYFEPLKERA